MNPKEKEKYMKVAHFCSELAKTNARLVNQGNESFEIVYGEGSIYISRPMILSQPDFDAISKLAEEYRSRVVEKNVRVIGARIADFLEEIGDNGSMIFVREKDEDGSWGSYSLHEIPFRKAMRHVARFVRENRQPLVAKEGVFDDDE